MPHKGEYEGKRPSKKEKAVAKESHKKRGKKRRSLKAIFG